MKELQEIGNRREEKILKELLEMYPYEQGYSVYRNATPKAPDFVIVTRNDGFIILVAECTNYDKDSYFSYPRLYRYIKTLSSYNGNLERVLVVSYPDNFRMIGKYKSWTYKGIKHNSVYTDSQCIEYAQKFLERHRITVWYRYCKD